MSDRTCIALVAIVALSACRPDGAERSDPYERAGDAGFVYAPAEVLVHHVPAADDAASRPNLRRVTGLVGGRGDLDGLAHEARLGLVTGMVRIDDAVVFVDQGNASVRRWTPATDVVETLVRFPTLPMGVPALPAHAAFDGAHTLYVTDRTAQIIHAVDLDRKTSSPFAGHSGSRGSTDGPLLDATFDTPTGIAFDGDHLYVSDVGNRHIRRIDIATRVVSTLPATFWQPFGLCYTRGAVYAVDLLTEALFRVDSKTGDANVVVGTNHFGYSGFTDGVANKARFHGPRGIACTVDQIFVAERDSLVRQWGLDAQKLTTIAGVPDIQGWRDGDAHEALFANLQSVLSWDATTIYLGDEGAIRKLSLGQTRTVSTVAGVPDQGTTIDLDHLEENAFINPKAVAFASGEAFVADCGTATLRRVDLASGATRSIAGDPTQRGFRDGFGSEARFACAAALTSDGAGTLFVGDRYNHAVRAVRIATGQVQTVAGSPSKCGNADGPIATATFCDPSGLAFGDGRLYVADDGSATIRQVDLAHGIVTTIAGMPFERGNSDGNGSGARFMSPIALAIHGGRLYVADREANAIRVLDTHTFAVTTLPTGFSRPAVVATRGDTELLVVDRTGLLRAPAGGGPSTMIVNVGGGLRVGSNAPLLHQPTSLAEVESGRALVLDGIENALVEVLY